MRGFVGVPPVAADKMDAVNAEARFNSFLPFVNLRLPVLDVVMSRFRSVLFFDAGRGSDQDRRLWDERFEIDWGFGFRLSSLFALVGPLAQSDLLPGVGLQTLRFDFPVYVSRPVRDENRLKFRWAISFSEFL